VNILVTGANRGLGLHLAERGAEHGHVIFAGVRDPSAERTEALRTLEKRYAGQIIIVPLDMEHEYSIRQAARAVEAQTERLDALVNNAAILLGRDTKLESLDFHELELTIRINLYGPMLVLKHFLPLLSRGTQQTIVNVTSESGSYANAYGGDYPYALSKAALNYFSAQVRHELRPQDIRVYAVHPGWIKTDMGTERAPGDPAETAEGILALVERKTQVLTDQVFIDFRGNPMPL
jgi:NAD(P)-dependent dehydrogenase (short-subunit alcohol dehydrogenase family)